MELDGDRGTDTPTKLMAETSPRQVTDLLNGTAPEYVTTPGNETTEVHLSFEQLGGRPVQGAAYAGDSLKLLDQINGSPIDLVVTSPPFALRKEKQYGNKSPEEYVDWFLDFAAKVYQTLEEDGSFVIDIGGGWQKGEPLRSHYHFELLHALTDDEGQLATEIGESFNLAQDFYWYNPAKLPTPAQWVTIERIRVKDAVNHVWWLSKGSAREKPDNRRVLKEYSDAQKQLMESGYTAKDRPSEHSISDTFDEPVEDGAIRPNFMNTIDESTPHVDPEELLEKLDIPENLLDVILENDVVEEFVQTVGSAYTQDNVLEIANTRSQTTYLKACKATDTEIHPARFPRELPKFFIQFLTEPGDTVLDIFAGSNTTGQMAQQTGRKWLAFEYSESYLEGSQFRFQNLDDVTEDADSE
ncbi:site-specific DNA-methyltransferase [Haloarchaeobius sp. FL176]|uniref:DNA-methyltransferase n=1 Tax=Haloarchaeobius sp. FL176 TaxID=2967129 RepID=UPI002148FF47|nr:site-specific DNA-methyltransferase [Haloarchaeobius sp. FL176]